MDRSVGGRARAAGEDRQTRQGAVMPGVWCSQWCMAWMVHYLLGGGRESVAHLTIHILTAALDHVDGSHYWAEASF
jgi:hypothetical protein